MHSTLRKMITNLWTQYQDINMTNGLYANINAKKKRIADGSNEKMNKVGSKAAPSKADFVKSAKTAKKK
jgi:hypothetical protein